MNNYFDAPPEGATPTSGGERPLHIQYKSGKIPQTFAASAVPNWVENQVANGQIGFSYFDKESRQKVSMPKMTFVILEVYAGVTGYDGQSVNYWSNRVLDTRYETLRVYASNHQGPIASGIYSQIQSLLPDGAKYTKFALAYCIELDRVVEIELSANCERGMKKGIADAEIKTGRNTKWEKVFILGLAQNDHLWGFILNGYARVDREGNDYSGKGDLFFEPVFHAGILNPIKQPELHSKCVDLQLDERARHKAYREKYAQQEQAAVPASTAPAVVPSLADVQKDDEIFIPEKPARTYTPPNIPQADDLPF